MISHAEAEHIVGYPLRRTATLYGRKLVVEEKYDDDIDFVGSLLHVIDLDTHELEEIGSAPLTWPEWYRDSDGVRVRLA